MRLGLIGIGVVGSVLKRWFEEHTDHELKLLDPHKGYNDSLLGCDAIFISIPVPANESGQDLTDLRKCVDIAKMDTENVFIRSTVLPETNDLLGTISMPEFLTERYAYEDFCKHPILLGGHKPDQTAEYYMARAIFYDELFPDKKKVVMSNVEAELSKYTHNCFGAMKVNFFNMIHKLSKKTGADFKNVKLGAFITGFVNEVHTQVPGHDGKLGYGGKCFITNMASFREYLFSRYMEDEGSLISKIEDLNTKYRGAV